MKTTTASNRISTPESIVNQISKDDLQEFRNSLREMMDGYFLFSSQAGSDPEPAWCAFRAIDNLLLEIQKHQQIPAQPLKAVGM